MEEDKLTDNEIHSVINTMVFYNRTDGYIARISGRITFFDMMPSYGAAPITLEQLQKINN